VIEEHCHSINCEVWIHDFVTAMHLENWLALFLAPYLKIWLFSGLDWAPWQKVDLATLHCS